jgi:hypothetical protein
MGGDLAFSLNDIKIEGAQTSFLSQDNGTPGDNPDDQPGSDQDNIQSSQETTPAADADNFILGTDNTGQANESQESQGSEQSSQEDDTPPSGDDSSQNSAFNALAQYLKEGGVLFVEDDIKDIKNVDDLKNLIEKSNEKARYANLNESQKRYHDALEKGVPVKEYEKIEKEIQTFTSIQDEAIETNPNLRYEILAIDMINQGMDAEKAKRFAQLAVKDEDSVEGAKKALNDIIEFKKNSFKELTENTQKETEITINQYKDKIFKEQKILDHELNQQAKNKLFDLITTKVDADEDGRPLNELQKWQRENPMESSIMMNYLYMMTNKGKDLSLIKNAGASVASQDLEKRLKQNLNFDEAGNLIIPDSMLSGSPSQNQQTSNNNNSNTKPVNINI